jgi:CRISPR system Cascade subunit CasC
VNSNEGLFVDIHVIQTVPPSCVNRDDTGTPKTCIYGGVPRARISSQCWKKAVREFFKAKGTHCGTRTFDLVGMISELIDEPNKSRRDALAQYAIVSAGIGKVTSKTDSETVEPGALFFMSNSQANALAELVIQDPEAQGYADKVLSGKRPKELKKNDEYAKKLLDGLDIDIALFGRMVAGNKNLSVDACAQVAHAFSTHAVRNEYDFFTAADDRSESSAAGHMNSSGFNSSTLYRYATLNVKELDAALGGEGSKATVDFIHAFVMSMPRGGQNSHANRTLPDAVYMTLSEDQPINLSGAFENPITNDRKDNSKGFAAASVERLAEYADDLYKVFVPKPSFAVSCVMVGDMSNVCEQVSFNVATKRLFQELESRLESSGE